MGYKVDFDALESMYGSVATHCGQWQEDLGTLNDALKVLRESSHISGKAADGIKTYLEIVHGSLVSLISELVTTHGANCKLYWADYQDNIDSATHAVIHQEELEDYKEQLESTKKDAISVDESLTFVLKGINDIFQVSYDDISEVDDKHSSVITLVTKLDTDITELEDTHHSNDFVNTQQLLTSIKAMIDEQLTYGRDYRTSFTMDSLSGSEAFLDLRNAHLAVEKELKDKATAISDADEILKKRVAKLEQEKKDREWAKWVAVGIGIVGSVVLIVVTAGAAGPGVCAVAGAVSGLVTTAATQFADNYVENGSMVEGMDWWEFGKACTVGAVTGAIGGYLGASSVGSAIKQPIQKATISFANTAVEKGAEGVINVAFDLGEAIVSKTPGDEVLSILSDDVENMFKDIAVEGSTAFVGDLVGGHFDVDTSKKGFLKTFGEESAENLAKAATGNVVETAWDIGDAYFDPEREKNMSTVLKEEATDLVGGFVEDVVSGEIEAVTGAGSKSYGQKHKDEGDASKIIRNLISDTVGESGGTFAGAVAEQGVELAFGERENVSLKEVWEEDLDGGREIAKTAADSAAEHISDKVYKDKEFQIKMQRKDYDKDGKIEVVEFDKYMVTKEDYDAAREVAGKGAYKDKTTQDILGLPKNTAVSEKNVTVKEVSISRLEESKYEGRKTTSATKIDYKSKRKKLYKK